MHPDTRAVDLLAEPIVRATAARRAKVSSGAQSGPTISAGAASTPRGLSPATVDARPTGGRRNPPIPARWWMPLSRGTKVRLFDAFTTTNSSEEGSARVVADALGGERKSVVPPGRVGEA